MKIKKLKKQTVKELDKLRNSLYAVSDKVAKSVDKAVAKIDDAITHVESLAAEKKSKKVKEMPESAIAPLMSGKKKSKKA